MLHRHGLTLALAFGLFMVGSLASGCAAKHVVRPDRLPPYATSPADFHDQTLYLRQLNIAGKSGRDSEEDVMALRAAFCDFAARLGRFRGVIDLKATPNAPVLPGIYIDVDLQVEHSSSRTYILDAPFFWPMSGYWPLTPQWGTASVKARVYAFDSRNNELWRTEQSGMASYSIVFYSWYRNGAIHDAYSEAYAQTFEASLNNFAASQKLVMDRLAKPEPNRSQASEDQESQK